MKHYMAVALSAIVWFGVPGAGDVSAQEAHSFEQLEVLVKPGEKIEVLGADGTLSSGKMESLTPTSLRVSINGSIRDYAQKDAIEIKKRKGDSLWNGAAIGAASGAGVGILDWVAEGGCDCTAGDVVAIVGVFSAMGAGVGIAIDALITHRKTIYRSPAPTSLSRLALAPLLSSRSKGVTVKFSF